MCIVVDPPTFVHMLKTDDPEHAQFLPVWDWVSNGPGKFVMGGTKYAHELRAVKSVLRALVELEKRRKIIRKTHEEVDKEEATVKLIESSTDFDDPHLVALVRTSGCRLVCTRDLRSHRFLRSTSMYASPQHRPSLYTRAKNRNLLCANNIAACCR